MTRARNLAWARAGNKSAARMAIIAMTTSNSIRVNAEQWRRFEMSVLEAGAEAKVAGILLSWPTIEPLAWMGASVQWRILYSTWRMLWRFDDGNGALLTAKRFTGIERSI